MVDLFSAFSVFVDFPLEYTLEYGTFVMTLNYAHVNDAVSRVKQ